MTTRNLGTLQENESEQSARDRALWCAVLRQAVTDATRPIAPSESQRAYIDRRHARAWLTANSADFRDVCHLADMDPDAVREHAIRLIAKTDADEPDASTRTGPAPKLITHNGRTQSVAQWAAEIGITKATLHARLRQRWTVARSLTTPIDLAHRSATKGRQRLVDANGGVGRASDTDAGTGPHPTAQISG